MILFFWPQKPKCGKLKFGKILNKFGIIIIFGKNPGFQHLAEKIFKTQGSSHWIPFGYFGGLLLTPALPYFWYGNSWAFIREKQILARSLKNRRVIFIFQIHIWQLFETFLWGLSLSINLIISKEYTSCQHKFYIIDQIKRITRPPFKTHIITIIISRDAESG